MITKHRQPRNKEYSCKTKGNRRKVKRLQAHQSIYLSLPVMTETAAQTYLPLQVLQLLVRVSTTRTFAVSWYSSIMSEMSCAAWLSRSRTDLFLTDCCSASSSTAFMDSIVSFLKLHTKPACSAMAVLSMSLTIGTRADVINPATTSFLLAGRQQLHQRPNNGSSQIVTVC
jgi:hypothetical protein